MQSDFKCGAEPAVRGSGPRWAAGSLRPWGLATTQDCGQFLRLPSPDLVRTFVLESRAPPQHLPLSPGRRQRAVPPQALGSGSSSGPQSDHGRPPAPPYARERRTGSQRLKHSPAPSLADLPGPGHHGPACRPHGLSHESQEAPARPRSPAAPLPAVRELEAGQGGEPSPTVTSDDLCCLHPLGRPVADGGTPPQPRQPRPGRVGGLCLAWWLSPSPNL